MKFLVNATILSFLLLKEKSDAFQIGLHHSQRRTTAQTRTPIRAHNLSTPQTSKWKPQPYLSTSTRLQMSSTSSDGTDNTDTNTNTDINETTNTPNASETYKNNGDFDLSMALFCGGLAFDAYAEPPADSSRWEKGSSGLNVAFQSTAFTRSLYKGLLQVTPLKCIDLPDEDNSAESLLTGSGVDAYLLVAVVEGTWKEDIDIIEQPYNDGVQSLRGCAHVGRSNTAWSNVNQQQARKKVEQGKSESAAYHIPSSWGKGGQAVWEDDAPFYLYVQDPTQARLVFTVMDDDVVGNGSSIGSTSKKLGQLIPAANVDPLKYLKQEVMMKLKKNGSDGKDVDAVTKDVLDNIAQDWEGALKLTSKPRIKDKNGQIATAAMAGAAVAGPAGAAVGGLLASFYEGDVRGRVEVKLRYMPIPPVPVERKRYQVKGGLPGVNWGELYLKHVQQVTETPEFIHLGGYDFEFCFFINHDTTGCSCAVYRSLEKRTIALSFRGTCELVDLVTDASIIQEAWIEGEDIEEEGVSKVHVGFRKSLDSISRRLKELILACPAPGEDISQYDLVVTGHSLGGALSTLFVADIGEYGIDAGRGLPQLEPSEPWWISLASTIGGKRSDSGKGSGAAPPRPHSLKMYNFGSPRVGNKEFVDRFDSLMNKGYVDEAYRIVNGQDVVARLPRTVNALGLVSIGYEHCGPTVLIGASGDDSTTPNIWIEGKSEGECPVRDGTALTSPLAKGSIIGDIVSAVKNEDAAKASDTESVEEGFLENGNVLSKLGSAMKGRLETLTVSDIPSLVGIDKKFVEREAKIIQSLVSGDALANHMEDQYYAYMGEACGLKATVGEEIRLMCDEKVETTDDDI